MEFLIQQMKLHVTFSSLAFFQDVICREKIIWSPFSSRLRMIKDINWFYLTGNAWDEDRFWSAVIPNIFKSLFLSDVCNFWSFQDDKGRETGLMSLNVYTTSHPLCQTLFYISRHELPVSTLEAAIPLARWKVSRRWPSTGCQIQTKQCNGLDLILMRLRSRLDAAKHGIWSGFT